MLLEPKISNPITLKLGVNKKVLISDDEILSLEDGVMFEDEHYGFNLITGSEGSEAGVTYATQCSVVGVQIVNDSLNVYEKNKYIPWRFDKDTGVLKNEAVFSHFKHSEMDYLRDTFGITGEEGLAQINDHKKI